MPRDPQTAYQWTIQSEDCRRKSEDYQRGWISPLYVRGLSEGRRKSEDYQRGWISPLYVRGLGEGRRDMQKIFRGGGSVQAMIHGRCCHFMVERTSHSPPPLG